MIQPRRGLCLALKPQPLVVIVKRLSGKELQGNRALQLEVFRLIDDAHTTFTDLLDDLVVRDGLADHDE